MKPDGKIQGVDVWVFDIEPQYVIIDATAPYKASRWLKQDGSFRNDGDVLTRLFPTREAALAHLKELEAKERPVIDLSTAKFGDKFKRRDGKIETYACPQEYADGRHVVQSGKNYSENGLYLTPHVTHPFDLVAPYTPPRTVEVWVEWWERTSGEGDLSVYASDHEKQKGLAHSAKCGHKTLVIKKITLTEGEGLAEPDVA